MSDHQVRVARSLCRVTVQRRSRNLYVALGEYQGIYVEARARREADAVLAWMELAEERPKHGAN
jgi:hypothetical protein